MYIPEHYNDSTPEEAKDFIKKNGFGILVSTKGGKPLATHIPMELYKNEAGEDVLIGHVARANEQWKTFEENEEVLAIFHGPHAYISSTWYTELNVPTWNYIAVHIYGTIKIITGDALYKALKQLIHTYETLTETHLKIEDIPKPVMREDMPGIVGFEIAIKEIKAAFKLSQSRDDESYRNIVRQLENSENQREREMASAMKSRRKEAFSNEK